ncbi:hypothetical protein INR49_019960, partial [Caranx melampygus]
RRPASDGEQRLLCAADLRASGLQRVLLVRQQVVVHGVHQQAVTLGVQHHARHRLDLTHQLARRDRLEADVAQQLGGVDLTRGVEMLDRNRKKKKKKRAGLSLVPGDSRLRALQ